MIIFDDTNYNNSYCRLLYFIAIWWYKFYYTCNRLKFRMKILLHKRNAFEYLRLQDIERKNARQTAIHSIEVDFFFLDWFNEDRNWYSLRWFLIVLVSVYSKFHQFLVSILKIWQKIWQLSKKKEKDTSATFLEFRTRLYRSFFFEICPVSFWNRVHVEVMCYATVRCHTVLHFNNCPTFCALVYKICVCFWKMTQTKCKHIVFSVIFETASWSKVFMILLVGTVCWLKHLKITLFFLLCWCIHQVALRWWLVVVQSELFRHELVSPKGHSLSILCKCPKH